MKIIKSKYVKGRFDVVMADGLVVDCFFDRRKVKRYADYYQAKIEI